MNFQGDLKSNFNTDGRTDGLRSTPHLPYGSNLPNAHEPNGIRDEFVTIGAVLADGLPWPTGERHPVIRSGERDEIPAHVRAAVWYRDEGRCKPCGDSFAPDVPLHLDHITPWSAGGPDTTDNLRLLCETHNRERSNFVDHARQVRPATWWCVNCYSRDGFGWDYDDKTVRCQRHGYSKRCRVVRRYEQQLLAEVRDGLEFANWHEQEPITHASVIAYCAHCNAPGLTDRPL